MHELYGIRCTLERNHKYFRLAIYQKQSRNAFAALIREHLLPSMVYKIG